MSIIKIYAFIYQFYCWPPHLGILTHNNHVFLFIVGSFLIAMIIGMHNKFIIVQCTKMWTQGNLPPAHSSVYIRMGYSCVYSLHSKPSRVFFSPLLISCIFSFRCVIPFHIYLPSERISSQWQNKTRWESDEKKRYYWKSHDNKKKLPK